MINFMSRLAIGAIAVTSTAIAAPPPPAPPPPQASIYRFDVAITGLDASAKPSTYTLVLEESSHGGLSTGANIPLVAPNQSSATRQDVGLKLSFRYTLRGAVVVLEGEVEVSSADPPTAATAATLHRIRAESVVPITAGTPALFSSLVDITSHRRYEVTVTAQRLL